MKNLFLLTIIITLLFTGLSSHAQEGLITTEYILSWDVCPTANTPVYRAEYYSVWISTTGNDVDDFTIMLFDETLSVDHTNWVYENRQVNIDDFANLTINVAFRHHNSTDLDRIVIDNVKLLRVTSEGEEEIVYLFEDFQEGIDDPAGEEWLPEGWISVDSDGDGHNWYFGYREADDEGAMRSESWGGSAIGPLTPDNWLITPAVLLGTVGIDELTELSINVFPNPASSVIHVNSNSEIRLIELVDMVGALVLSRQMNDVNTSIDVSLFNNGLYFLRMHTDEGILVKKLHIIE